MDNDGDIEVVSVTLLKKPTTAQQQLYVLDVLQRVKDKIPTAYDEFFDFVQTFSSFKVDEVVLHNAWSLLSKCLNSVIKPTKCFNDNETIIIESDNDCINEEDIKKDRIRKQISIKKTEKIPLKDQKIEQLKKEILQIMKQHLSLESNGNFDPQSSVGKSYSKKMDRLILKKLEMKAEITVIKKEKRKSSYDNEEDEQQIEEITENKPKKRRKSETDKKRRKSKLSKEEEAEKLRMDLFIDKIIELSLPITPIQNRNEQKRHSI